MYPKSANIALPVDLVRTIAIVLVIVLHAAIEPWPNIYIMSSQGIQLWWASNVYVSLASPAVPLFVMLTGALLLQPNKADEPLKVFFRKRAIRIALPLVFWGVVYFAWRLFAKGELLAPNVILQGVLAGPYFHFWFIYLLLGLYFLTPIIRVLVTYANLKIMKFFLTIWFIGTAIIPLVGLCEGISPQVVWFKQTVFIISGMIGYFILGAYTTKLRLRSSILCLILACSFLWTIIGTYLLVGTIGERYSQFFYDASSFSVIMASIALFLLLATIPTKTLETRFPLGSQALKLISNNTLPIYFFHVIVLEALQKGYFGFKISLTFMNPMIEIPVIASATLLICLAILVPLKRVPYLNKILG